MSISTKSILTLLLAKVHISNLREDLNVMVLTDLNISVTNN